MGGRLPPSWFPESRCACLSVPGVRKPQADGLLSTDSLARARLDGFYGLRCLLRTASQITLLPAFRPAVIGS